MKFVKFVNGEFQQKFFHCKVTFLVDIIGFMNYY